MSPFPNDAPVRRIGLSLLNTALVSLALAAGANAAPLTLRWSDTSANEYGFKIERATSSAGPYVQIATTPADVTSYVDDAPNFSTSYVYRVRAYNAGGDSAYSNTATATTPPPPNTAPTISAIADQSINEDGATAALAFTIGDAETGSGSLVLTANSSNSALIPDENLVLGGSGSARTILARPVADAFGTTTVTLQVSDGSLVTAQSFTVTVVPVNDLPTISAIADRILQAGTSSGTIAFAVADVETPAGTLVVSASSSNTTLLPNANLVLGGTDAAHTLTFATPATTGGSVVVTVRVSDGSATSSSAFNVTLTPANTSPTITAIAAQTVIMNSSSPALAFTVGDAQTAAANLLVSATSSNTALLPDSGITLGGSGASRTISVRPAADAAGTSTVTVRVSDGALSSSTSFVVTVPPNTAPTISAVANRTVPTAVSSGLIAFTVGDTETPAANLAVAASSSNQTLLPDSALVLGGSDASRSLMFTPPSTLNGGTATVTLRVSDGTLATSTSFVVTIDATNTAPTITAITGQNIAMNTSAGPLAFTINDTQTPAANLSLVTNASNQTLVPLGNITLGGSGASRTVTIRPTYNTTGWSTIWIKVSDGALSQTISFVVNVSAVMSYTDIGAPAIAGSQTTASGTITMTAGGADIWGGSDQFRFGSLPLQGDSEITVRLASLTNSHAWAKAGLMYRNSTDANAAYVFVCVTPSNGVALQYRTAAGTASVQKYVEAGAAPEWLKITRTGDTFYAFNSSDGVTWDLLDFVTVDLADAVPAGLAVTSHSDTVAITATFDSFSVD